MAIFASSANATPTLRVFDGDRELTTGSVVDFGTARQGSAPLRKTFRVESSDPVNVTTPTLPAGYRLSEGLDSPLAFGRDWKCQGSYTAFPPRSGHTAVMFNGKIWVIGGHTYDGWYTNNSYNDVWNSEDGKTWRQVAGWTPFKPRTYHSTVIFNKRIWVIGGVVKSSISSDTFLNDVWSSSDGVHWRQEAKSAPFSPRCGQSSVIFNGRIWIIGGYNTTYDSNTYQNVYHCYNDIWSSADGVNWRNESKTAPFTARGNHKSTVFNDRIWVIGGFDSSIAGQNDVWNSADGVHWQQVTAHGQFSSRWDHAFVAFNNRLWVIGGTYKQKDYVQSKSDVWDKNDVWSSADGVTWQQEADSANFSPRNGHVAIPFNDRLWIIGGYGLIKPSNDEGQAINNNDAWSTNDGANWRQETNATQPPYRGNHTLVNFKNRLWLIGGSDRGESTYLCTNDVWSSADGVHWRQETSNAPFKPRDRHTCVVYKDRIWIIGGTDYRYGAAYGPVYFNDVWSSSDGVHWRRETSAAPFSLRSGHSSVVFNDRIWVIGGETYNGSTGLNVSLNDVWSSADGVNWREETKSAPFASRYGHASVVFGNRIWVMAGGGYVNYNRNVLYGDVWSSEDGVNWQKETNSNTAIPRQYFSSVVFNNRIYAMGGEYFSDGYLYRPDIVYHNDIWSSADGRVWRQEKAEKQFDARSGLTGVVFNDRIRVIGGVIGDKFGVPNYINDSWSSADGVNWSKDSGCPRYKTRTDFSSLVFNNRLWMIGGGTERLGAYDQNYNDVWSSADGVELRQETGAAQFFPRNGQSSVVFNGRIWVIGGSKVDRGYDVFYKYCLNDVWSSADGVNWRLETERAPFEPRYGHCSVVYNGRIWVIGGLYQNPQNSADKKYFTDVWSSADGKNWRQETDSAPFTPSLDITTLVYDNKIYVIGTKGWSQNGFNNDIWSTIDGIKWDKVTESARFTPRNAHPGFVFNDKLWSIGSSLLSYADVGTNDNDLWNTDGTTWQLVKKVLPVYNIYHEQNGSRYYTTAGLALNDQAFLVTGCKNPVDGRVYDVWSSKGYSGTFTIDLPTSQNGLFNGKVNLSPDSFATSGTALCSFQITGQVIPDLSSNPIQVFSPNGSESCRGGELYPIHWKSDLTLAGTGIKLELWNHDGHLLDLGYGWSANGETTTTVLLPLVPEGSDYQILARSTWDPQLFGVNPGPFTITGGLLCLHWPDIDTIWHAGDVEPIWWQINPQLGGTAVRFELWRNGVKTTDLGIGYDPDGEAVAYVTVPSTAPAHDYKLRLVSLWDENCFDECDGFVTVENSAYVSPTDQNAITPGNWLYYQ